MRVEDIKIQVKMRIPFDGADGNGVVHTKDAIEGAVKNVRSLPLLFRDNANRKASVIGAVEIQEADWDYESGACVITFDGVVFSGGCDVLAHEIDDGRISRFEILSVGISADNNKPQRWVIEENGCVVRCPECRQRLELCYPDGTEVRRLPHCPHCGQRVE